MKPTTKLTSPKLTGEERRAAIIKAVRKVFAEKGFHGTTTRALAEAADVSEALLFKHFPNKEALYLAMQHFCCNEQDMEKIERLKTLEPSASTLVLMVHFMVSRILSVRVVRDEDRIIQHRLMLRSLAEDGEFARLFLRRLASDWIPKFEECLVAAVAAGDAYDTPAPALLRGWFVHHLSVMIAVYSVPEPPVVEYGVPLEQLAEQAIRFCLRGMGLKEEVIQRCYNPTALALLSS